MKNVIIIKGLKDTFEINDIAQRCYDIVKSKCMDMVVTNRFKICFIEAMINAIEHGNKKDIKKQITITLTVKEGTVEFSIEDFGEGFDWRTRSYEFSGEEGFRGRGLKIVKYYSTSLTFNEKGNEITVVISN